MYQARKGLIVMGLVLCVCAGAVSRVGAATVTRYSSEANFLAALGTPRTAENFDGYDAGTCFDANGDCASIPGVTLTSPNFTTDTDYVLIQTAAYPPDAASSPNVLIGGNILASNLDQIITMDFSPAVVGVGFFLTGLAPSTESQPISVATVKVFFSDESSQTFNVADTDGNSDTPEYIGLTSTRSIFEVVITSGRSIVIEGPGIPNLYGIDNLTFAESLSEDTLPPICSRDITESPTSEIHGHASDEREGDSGIVSVALVPGSSNVSLVVDPGFDPPAEVASFTVTQIDHALIGKGVVVATDGAGHTCTLGADFRALPEGPLTDAVLCTAPGILFQVSYLNEQNMTSPGSSACSATPIGPGEPPLPPGYEPSPSTDLTSPCTVLTIDSPVAGEMDMVYKKDGAFDSRLRLLFSRSTDGGLSFPDFRDITQSVRPTGFPDPTRAQGTGTWSPVKVTCAILPTTIDCTGISPTLDFDGDGFPLCPATGAADCNDQIAAIHPDPGAKETCNGLDDNCDGTIDNIAAGDPGNGGACSVPGKSGVCAAGASACVDGALVCNQTVFPTREVCDGKDNDCDGQVDENHVIGEYQQPVNADGTSIFKYGRVVPFKFLLTTCSGAPVTTDHPRISVFLFSNNIVGTDPEDVVSPGNANSDNLYRCDTSGQCIYNLRITMAPGTSNVVRTTLDDGSTRDVIFSVRK